MGRNILINSQLKRILFISNYKKKGNETEKDKEKIEKEKSTNESDFSENEIPDLSSMKPFEFKPKTSIKDINSSSSNHEEEGIEDKVKQIGNSKWY